MDQKKSIKIFVALAWFVSIYHLLLGLIGTFAPGSTVVSVAEFAFGVAIDPTAQFFVLSKFIAAYMILMGLLMFFVAREPERFGKLAWAVIIFFAIRVFNRLVFFDVLNGAFGTTMSQNMMTVIPISLVAIGLAIYMPLKAKK